MRPIGDVIPSRTTPWVTVVLIAANLVTFGYAAALVPSVDAHAWVHRFTFVPAEASWTTAATALLVHENGLHLALNLIVLWVFGDNVEDQLGHARFLALYLVAGSAGWMAARWATPASIVPLLGSGGAIAGVLGAYFVMFPRSRVLLLVPARGFLDAVELPAVLLAAGWFALHTLGGLGRFDVPLHDLGPSLWPFAGGAAAGGLAARVARRPERRRVEWWGT